MAVGAKRERKFRAHYIDASPTRGDAPTFVRIGKDNTDLSRTINYTENEILNVLGETEFTSTRAGDTMDVSPYYIRKGEPLGELLEKIDIDELQLDDLKRDYVEVTLDEESLDTGIAQAFMQTCDVKPSSAGGPADNADMVAFTLSFSGPKVRGTFALSTKTFTPTV